jgi:hypothetical protein
VDVKGTALDDVGVIYVLVCVNDPTFENETNTTVDANGEWHATVKLVKGFNTIYVRAYDAAGRSSSSELRVFSEPKEVEDGDKGEMNDPWWLPLATLAFIVLLIMVVIFGLWAKRRQTK